jgi:hypothetical protein
LQRPFSEEILRKLFAYCGLGLMLIDSLVILVCGRERREAKEERRRKRRIGGSEEEGREEGDKRRRGEGGRRRRRRKEGRMRDEGRRKEGEGRGEYPTNSSRTSKYIPTGVGPATTT